MPIIIMICGAILFLIVYGICSFISMKHHLKRHQEEWNELKKILIEVHPHWGQDELMQKYLEYCRIINYNYIPKF